MKKIFKKILDALNDNVPPTKSKEEENAGIIRAYHLVKEADPSYSEPNYMLAEKVFREYNDFNLKNLDEIHWMYLDRIPKSLLPYPKNYIKCAYYLFLESAKKQNNLEMFKLIQETGVSLFTDYPDYENYKKKLKLTNEINDKNKEKSPYLEMKEKFKKVYGVYEVSESDYYNSPSSIDSTDEKLIYDFGVLPEIEKDIDWGEIINKKDK